MKRSDSKKVNNVNLLRKIVWSFAKHSKEPYDDLFQEGYIGYMWALETYNPDKGAFSTHAWRCISQKIKDYLKMINTKNKLLEVVEDFSLLEPATPDNDFLDSLPKESLEIVDMIMKGPKPFIIRTQQDAQDRLIYILVKNQGWSKNKVLFGMKWLLKICK